MPQFKQAHDEMHALSPAEQHELAATFARELEDVPELRGCEKSSAFDIWGNASIYNASVILD